jgi:hypothetical protein
MAMHAARPHKAHIAVGLANCFLCPLISWHCRTFLIASLLCCIWYIFHQIFISLVMLQICRPDCRAHVEVRRGRAWAGQPCRRWPTTSGQLRPSSWSTTRTTTLLVVGWATARACPSTPEASEYRKIGGDKVQRAWGRLSSRRETGAPPPRSLRDRKIGGDKVMRGEGWLATRAGAVTKFYSQNHMHLTINTEVIVVVV